MSFPDYLRNEVVAPLPEEGVGCHNEPLLTLRKEQSCLLFK